MKYLRVYELCEHKNEKLAGFMGGIGLGGEGSVLEGHTAMSNTFPTVGLGNMRTLSWDKIYERWKVISLAWEGLYNQLGNK